MSKWLAIALESMGEQGAGSSDSPNAKSANSAKRSERDNNINENNGITGKPFGTAVLPIAAKRSEISVSDVGFAPPRRFEGVPGEWIAGIEHLNSMPVPLDLEMARWLEVRADAERFLKQWSARASALGWDELSLFGACPDAPEHRIDLAGLVWLLKGKTVAVMTEQFAVIDLGRGIRQSVPRQVRAGQVPIWDLPTPQKRTFQQEATGHGY